MHQYPWSWCSPSLHQVKHFNGKCFIWHNVFSLEPDYLRGPVDAGNCHRPAHQRLLFYLLILGKTFTSLFRFNSTKDSNIPFLPPKEATFGTAGVSLCLQIVPFLYYKFRTGIEDLFAHLDYPQPGQLEESLRHLAGVVILGSIVLQTLNFIFAVLHHIRILNPLACFCTSCSYPGNRTGA